MSEKESQKNSTESVKSTQESEKPSKFKFECIRCGACCINRKPIPVTFSDIARWTKTGSFMTIVLPNLELGSLSDEDELSKIALIPYITMKNVNEQGLGTCPFYDKENKMCNIYFSIPIFCKTFPLSFNGEKYYISDPSCGGIGKGDMTKEKLEEMRNYAIRDFNERAETSIAMVPIQGLFIKYFMKQSQEKVDKLSKEDKERLDELIHKSQKDNTTNEE